MKDFLVFVIWGMVGATISFYIAATVYIIVSWFV